MRLEIDYAEGPPRGEALRQKERKEKKNEESKMKKA